MQSRIIVDSREESLLSTHKVLRNTYFLLALTLAFSAVVNRSACGFLWFAFLNKRLGE